jgi:hypothetical protein
MKNLLIVPAVFIATATFVSVSIVCGPIINKIKQRKKDKLKKYYQSFYMSKQ